MTFRFTAPRLSTPSLGITSLSCRRDQRTARGRPFNSLSRDHRFRSAPLDSVVSGILSTPSLGITSLMQTALQLAMMGALSTPSLGITCYTSCASYVAPRTAFNSLSRDHKWASRDGSGEKDTIDSFNSLSRDHGRCGELRRLQAAAPCFQLPLSGSQHKN